MQNGKFFLFSFIIFTLCLLIYLFKGFLLVICIASLMAVATSNINAKFLKISNNKILAASLTTICMVMLFFAPFVYAMIEIAKTLKNFDVNIISQTINYIKNYQFTLPESFSFLEPKIKEFLSNIDLNSLSKQVLNSLSNFTKSSASFLVDMVLICIFYFFANLYGTELIIYIKSIIPISKDEIDEVLSEVGNVMAVVLYSMVIISIFEGTLFAIIAIAFGYDGILMGIIFAVSSLIPVVGGGLVYIPLSLYEFTLGNTKDAIIIFLYSVIVISFIADTLIKPLIIKWINEKLVKTPTKINELLIFLAMMAGISSFGFWGIILGPAILTFFISTIRLYVILKEKNLI